MAYDKLQGATIENQLQTKWDAKAYLRRQTGDGQYVGEDWAGVITDCTIYEICRAWMAESQFIARALTYLAPLARLLMKLVGLIKVKRLVSGEAHRRQYTLKSTSRSWLEF